MATPTVFTVSEIEIAASRLDLVVTVDGDRTTVAGQVPGYHYEAKFSWSGDLKMNELGQLVVGGIVNLRDEFAKQLMSGRMNLRKDIIVDEEQLRQLLSFAEYARQSTQASAEDLAAIEAIKALITN
ncbi:hypothetical protein KBA63_01645 [Candidatus Woesebacteria bacterium]|nr:hypothetical protein [Candidatus Woesebacteria bacterium]